MKKVISLLLVCMMMLSMVTVVSAAVTMDTPASTPIKVMFGEDGSNIIDAREIKPGEYIDIPVKLSGLPVEVTEDQNTGIVGGQFRLNFDTSRLTFYGLIASMQTCAWNTRDNTWKYSDITWTPPDSATAATGIAPIQFAGAASTAALTQKSFEKTPVYCIVSFVRPENAKGTATIICDLFEMSTAEHTVSEVDYTQYDYLTGYFNISECKVLLTNTYAVTKAADAEAHGTVEIVATETDSSAADYNELDGGENVTVTVTPNDGYDLGTLSYAEYTYNDNDEKVYVKEDGTENTKWNTITSGTSFAMPTKNVEIKATYTPKTYGITAERIVAKDSETAQDTESGVTFAISDTEIAFGTEVTVTPALDAGVTLNTLTATSEGKDVNGEAFGTVNLLENEYKFTMPSGSVTISGTATYTAGTFQVKLTDDSSANDNTMYVIDGLGSYADGSNVTITVTPKDGYNIAVSDITSEVDTVTSPYTFTMPRLADDTSYLIKVVATKKVYTLDPTDPDSKIDVSALSSVAEVKFDAESASLGDEVKFTIKPNSSDKSINIDEIVVKDSNGDPITITWSEPILMSVYYEGSLELPADGVVVFSTTDGTDGTVSALTELTEVTLTYEGKNADGSYDTGDSITKEPVTVSSGKVTKALGKFLDISATPAKTLTINVTGKSDGATAEIYEGQYTVENKPDVANIYANDKTLGAKAQATFTIFVKAADGITEEAYVLVVTNTTDPAGGATIELVTKSGTATDPDADPTAATGSRYEAAIVAKGLSTVGSVNAISFDLKLPTYIMTDGNSEHGVTYTIGSGIAYNNINMINYDAATGVLSFSVVNGGTAFAETDGAVELLNISFEVLDGIDVESFPNFEITWDSAKYADGDEENAKDFGTNAFVETVKLVRSNEEILASKIADIDALANELEYSEQKWENEVLPILNQAKEDVAEANLTEEQMDDIVEAAGVKVGKIQKLASDVTYNDGTQDVTVTAYKTELSDSILEGVVLSNYLTEDQLKITDTAENDGIAEVAKKAIADSKSRDEDVLARIVTDAKDDIANVPTKAQQIEKYQAMITVDESKYVTEALADTDKGATADGAVTAAVKAAKAAIGEATSTEEMQDIVDNFATTYNALQTELLTTVRPEYNEKVAALSNAFTVEVDGTSITTKDVNTTNYTQENIDKIEIYQSIANAKIAAVTSEADMQAAVDEAMKKIALVPTIENAVTAAIEKINKYDETGYGLEDIITAVGQDMAGDVSVYNEALYEAAIEYAKSKDTDGKLDQSQIQAAVTEVNTIISVNTDADDTNDTFLKGDFNVSTNVDLQDVAGSMKYVCGTLTWVPQAQGVYNADIHTPGDGVLTVFDVAEIMQIVDAQ